MTTSRIVSEVAHMDDVRENVSTLNTKKESEREDIKKMKKVFPTVSHLNHISPFSISDFYYTWSTHSHLPIVYRLQKFSSSSCSFFFVTLLILQTCEWHHVSQLNYRCDWNFAILRIYAFDLWLADDKIYIVWSGAEREIEFESNRSRLRMVEKSRARSSVENSYL